MDGYAIHHDDSADNPVTLPVSLDIMAGSAADQPLARGSAARIMTGAPIPPVATAVIPVEDTDDNWQKGESAPPPAQVQLEPAGRQGREYPAFRREYPARRDRHQRGHGDWTRRAGHAGRHREC